MNTKSFSITLLSAIVLAACGGSSSSSNNTHLKEGDGAGKVATQNVLKVKAVYRDTCGNETPNTSAALIIHNDDFSNDKIINADAAGVMTFSSDDSNRHVSLVMSEKYSYEGITPVRISTIVDQPLLDMGTEHIYTSNDDSCTCKEFSVFASSIALSSEVYAAYDSIDSTGGFSTSSNFGYLSESFDVLRSCKMQSGNWSPITTMFKFYNPGGATGAIIDSTSIQDVIDNDALNSFISVEHTLNGIPVDINTQEGNVTSVSAIIDNLRYIREIDNNVYGSNILYTFDHESIDHHLLTAYDFEELDVYVPDVSSVSFYSYVQKRTKNIHQTFDLETNEANYTEFLSIITSADNTYNLSHYSGFDYVLMSLRSSLGFQGLLNWDVIAPVSGKVPRFENLDFSQFFDSKLLMGKANNSRLIAGIAGFDAIDSYQDYLIKRPTTDFSATDTWNDFKYMRVGINFESGVFNSINNTSKLVNTLTSVEEVTKTAPALKEKSSVINEWSDVKNNFFQN